MPHRLRSLDEQRAIADYLDRETARIDTLIEEQQRLVEMLRERRESVWSQTRIRLVAVAQPCRYDMSLTSIVDGPFGHR